MNEINFVVRYKGR